MKLQCAQEALADALATVGRIVSAKTTLAVLSNVLIEAEPEDGLRLVATNLDLTVSRRIRATVNLGGRTTAPARLLAEDFPPVPAAADETRFEIDAAALKSAIDQVAFAAAPDDTRPVLAGVLLRLDAAKLVLASADGFRLSVWTVLLPDTTKQATWVIPARALVEVARSLSSAPACRSPSAEPRATVRCTSCWVKSRSPAG